MKNYQSQQVESDGGSHWDLTSCGHYADLLIVLGQYAGLLGVDYFSGEVRSSFRERF